MTILSRLTFALIVLATPLAAQEPTASPWTFSLSAGAALGGPMGQLRDRMIAELWTDQYCDYRRSDCHQGPTARGVSVKVSGAVSRQLSDRLGLKGVMEVGDLGQIIGAKGQTQIKASWKTTTLGTALMLRPISRVRIGAGPMIALLTRHVVTPAKSSLIRAGMLFEGGIRSSERTSSFVELVVSYRLLPRLPEGPWPVITQSTQAAGGPTGIDANFSHVTIGLGAGVRF